MKMKLHRIRSSFIGIHIFMVVIIISTVCEAWEKKSFVDGAKIMVKVGDGEVTAEVAQSNMKKHSGLRESTGLNSGEGMLFVFDSPRYYSFWNKGVFFTIDIIWIRGGVVVDVSEDMPDFETSPYYTVTPKAETDFVLETTSGFISKHGIKIGDRVLLEH